MLICFACLLRRGAVFLLTLFEVACKNNMPDLGLGRHGLCFCTSVGMEFEYSIVSTRYAFL